MKKYHTMLRYIIKFFIVIIFSVGYSQENPSQPDSLKIKEKYGIRFGIDLSKQVRMITEDYNGISLYADLRIKERLFIVAEVGNDDKKIYNENINSNFKGSYIKAGFNYNFYNNPPGLENEIYFGFRFATSSFKSEVFDYLVYDLDKYWENGRIEDYSEYNNLSANWIELILGFNAKISKNIFMGTSLRLNRMINQKSPENFGNLYIPGFNIVTEDNNFGTGITYTLTYRIPIVKK